MSAGSKFHSCGEETEKPLLPDRSFRYRILQQNFDSTSGSSRPHTDPWYDEECREAKMECSRCFLLFCFDVTSLIRKAPLKQYALDSIPTWLLKNCIDLLAPYITSVFNITLSSGYVPSSFKQAFITPLLKKNGLEETIVGNYRPVSNLSVLSKTLEHAVHQQIENYLNQANLLPAHQSA